MRLHRLGRKRDSNARFGEGALVVAFISRALTDLQYVPSESHYTGTAVGLG